MRLLRTCPPDKQEVAPLTQQVAVNSYTMLGHVL
jgi:hypothetical protein